MVKRAGIIKLWKDRKKFLTAKSGNISMKRIRFTQSQTYDWSASHGKCFEGAAKSRYSGQ